MQRRSPAPLPSTIVASYLRAASAMGPAVFTHKQLLARVRAELAEWCDAVGAPTVVKTLLHHEVALRFELRSQQYRSTTRYRIGDVSPIQIASSLRPQGYLSHATAVFLHGLTDEATATHYVNVEQTPKPAPSGDLAQHTLTLAFSRPQRVSNHVFTHDGVSYVVLSGKYTGQFGVVELPTTNGDVVRTTDLERTLVDIVVRPTYASGLYQVRKAFEAAASRVSIDRIVETLHALQHVYPYHQALGFLLERAGVASTRLRPLHQMDRTLDFFLTHGMKNPVLDSTWRIYHPKGF